MEIKTTWRAEMKIALNQMLIYRVIAITAMIVIFMYNFLKFKNTKR